MTSDIEGVNNEYGDPSSPEANEDSDDGSQDYSASRRNPDKKKRPGAPCGAVIVRDHIESERARTPRAHIAKKGACPKRLLQQQKTRPKI